MKNSPKNLWEMFKEYAFMVTGIPVNITEYKAIQPILKRCLFGYNNGKIAKYLGMRVEYVQDVLIEYMGFRGWKSPLDFNPLALYNTADRDFSRFIELVVSYSDVEFEKIKIAFELCERYYKIVKRIEKYDD